MSTAELARLSARLRAAAAAPPASGPLRDALRRAAHAAEADISAATGRRFRFELRETTHGVRAVSPARRIRAARAGRSVVVSPAEVLQRYLDRELPDARRQVAAAARARIAGRS